jgi:Fic family protein
MDLDDILDDDRYDDELYESSLSNEMEEKRGMCIMDRERNVLLAKKYMVESIYRSANIEGIGMTFPETQTICDGMSISGHTIDEINAVNDLKNAWRWIFQNIDNPIDIDVLCQLNRIAGKYTVLNSGSIRDMYDEPIRVPLYDGKNYYPPLPPSKDSLNEIIEQMVAGKTLDSALELFCFICKAQIFNDGNKRTATLITNLYMIQNGFGILSIPVDKKLDFYNALTRFYDDDANKGHLISFLKEYCLTGNSQ